MTQPNPSTALARSMIDELRRHGVTLAVVSPGSRSSALAIAVEETEGIETRVVLDERSAAFMAIGHARQTETPAVCIATSGTAVANYLPAIVEADEDLVPLIAMTADRPPELRHVAANQTVNQSAIFGARVRWFADVGPADAGIDQNNYWRTTVSQAVARALGFGGAPGPVHLNVAFREPSVPVADDGRATALPYPYSTEGRTGERPWQELLLHRPPAAELQIDGGRRGLIIAGDGADGDVRIVQEAQRLGWPVLATAQSGLRGPGVLTGYHHLLVQGVPLGLEPDVVVSIGRTGPSDRLGALTAVECPQFQIDRWGRWIDPRRHSTVMVHGEPSLTLASITGTTAPDWAHGWMSADGEVRTALDERLADGNEMSGPGIARHLSDVRWETLVVGSSMPIRDVDAHTVAGGRVVSNRGASGIDGFVSTAIGAAISSSRTAAFCGDLSLLHDSSGLLVDNRPDLVIVVADNNGGGLFDLLPQAAHAPAFEKLFIAPHNTDIAALVSAHGIESDVIEDPGSLAKAMGERLESGGIHVLVAPIDREADLKTRRALDDAARIAVSGF